MDLAALIIQAIAAIATAVAAFAAWRAARAAQDSAQQGALDLEDERKDRRIAALERVHEHLIEMEALGDMNLVVWHSAFARFRAASLATTDPLVRCVEFNNAAIGGKREGIAALLRAAIAEVQHAISRAKQGRPLGDSDHGV